MKNLLQFSFTLVTLCVAHHSFSQNVMINVLSQNSGKVKRGELTYFEVTIYNTSTVSNLAAYKIRPQISFPSLVHIPPSGHSLPEGWAIFINGNGTVTLSNGTDVIPPQSDRKILIAMKGVKTGGPASIPGNLFFSNGSAPGTTSGIAPKDDNTADNTSNSSITVL